MRIRFALPLTAAVLTLTGCGSLFGPEGYFRDRGDDYLNTGTIQPITVPPGLDSEAIGQLYVVPELPPADEPLPQEFAAPRPQPLAANATEQLVKIQKLDDERWILVNAPPGEVWPRVRNFLNRQQLPVVYTEPSRGLIETDWLQFKGDQEVKDKYRFQIEPGVQPGSTEVHIRQVTVDRAVPGRGQINWPAQSPNPEREEYMIKALAGDLANEVGGASVSLLAQNIGGGPKVEFIAPEDGYPHLRLYLSLNRALASVSYGLDQGGFSIDSVDQDAREYQVTYLEPRPDLDNDGVEDEPGFWSRLWGDDDREQGNYLVRVRESRDGVDVFVFDANGSPLDNVTAKRVLKRIRGNLT